MSISRFEKFNKVLDIYMPDQGEGESLASQIATAVAKIVYRWFNDGDTVSSKWMVQSGTDEGGMSQFANWLYINIADSRPMFRNWLDKFDNESVTDAEYENFLYDMCKNLLDPDFLDGYSTEPKYDSIYNASKYNKAGVFAPTRDDEDEW